jgi:alpha-methylacyl-CoA racemase
VARGTFVKINGVEQNAPVPRFSRTPAQTPEAPRRSGEDTDAILAEAGYSPQQIQELRTAGALT